MPLCPLRCVFSLLIRPVRRSKTTWSPRCLQLVCVWLGIGNFCLLSTVCNILSEIPLALSLRIYPYIYPLYPYSIIYIYSFACVSPICLACFLRSSCLSFLFALSVWQALWQQMIDYNGVLIISWIYQTHLWCTYVGLSMRYNRQLKLSRYLFALLTLSTRSIHGHSDTHTCALSHTLLHRCRAA